jgi:uncharacterized membrane protein
MWFLGLVIGGIVGAIGGGGGAMLGAFVGLLAGLAFSRSGSTVDEKWKSDVEDALRQLHRRVADLERSTGRSQAEAREPETEPVSRPFAPDAAAPATSAPMIEPAQPVAPVAAEPAASPVEVPSISPVPPVGAATAESAPAVREQSGTAGRQVLGAAIGGVLGLIWGGGGAMLVGAFIGWVIALVTLIGRPDETTQAAPEKNGDASFHDAPPTGEDRETMAGASRDGEVTARPVDVTAASPLQPGVSEETEPQQSSWWDHLVGGNIVAKVGVVILFFGVGFLLKYAYDQGMLPVPVRLAGVAVFGFGMLFAGWKLQASRRLYGLILQGGGIGLLYLDTFFALRVYGLVGVVPGFAAFMALGVDATLLAVRQDSKVLAVLGLTGAFLAPVLVGSKSGNHVLLFSYYTMLNGFILAISWFKAWRELNLVGFVFTFIIGSLWGAGNYRPELFASVEPFVLIFFGMYLVIPILFAHRQPPELKGLVDGTLVFGTPLAAAFMQTGLVRDMPYGLAWSAGCAMLLYAVLAAVTVRREGMRLLGETYIALSVVSLTLAIFFALDAYPTFALWTLEGAAVVWVGLRQKRLLARMFGLALQLLGAAYFLVQYPNYSLANPWFNDFVLGCAIISVAGFIIGWLLHKYRAELTGGFEPRDGLVLVWAGAWWFIAGVHCLHQAYAWESFVPALLLFVAASCAAAEFIGGYLAWPGLRRLLNAHMPTLILIAMAVLLSRDETGGFARPLAHGGYWAWPLNFAVVFWAYYRQLDAGLVASSSPRYAATWCLIAALATWDALWLLAERDYAGVIVWGAVGLAAAGLRFWWRERSAPDAAPYGVWILGWGLLWWFCGGAGLIDRHVEAAWQEASLLLFTALTFLAVEWIGRRAGWSGLRAATLAHVPVLIAIMLFVHEPGAQPLGGGGWAVWPASFAILFWTLERQRQDNVAIGDALRYWACWILVAVLATHELVWQLDHRRYEWMLFYAVLGVIGGHVRFHLRERGREDAAPVSTVILAWSTCFWFIAGLGWLEGRVEAATVVAANLAFVALSSALFEAVGRIGTWLAPRRVTVLLPAAMVIAAFLRFGQSTHPFSAYGWAAWPVAFLALYSILHGQERDKETVFAGTQHVLALWLAVLVVAWEVAWQANDHGFGRAWALAPWGLVPALVVGCVSAFSARANWPFGAHFQLFQGIGLVPLVLLTGVWSLYVNFSHPGTMAPLPYFPVLNPLDVAQIVVLWAAWRWSGTFDGDFGPTRARMAPIMAVLAFVWVNCVMLRSIHYWGGVDYTADALFRSVVAQSALSLLWTAMALVLMLRATRSAQRGLWVLGATLLGLVVLKLFLMDLANSGTVERIVTFIGVGVGLLAIGYLAPVPPGGRESESG